MEQRGDAITNSWFYRDFCEACGEPIRVRLGDLKKANHCDDCYNARPPAAHTGLVKRQRTKLGKTTGG